MKNLEQLCDTDIAFRKYYRSAANGLIPWSICSNNGWSLAHQAADDGKLPDDFNMWEIATKIHNITVAHVAAGTMVLNLTPKQWTMADNTGWTVAHVAACSHNLPKNFDQWDLADNTGLTVRSIYELKNKKPDTLWNKIVKTIRIFLPI